MDHVETIESEVVERHVHRPREARRDRELELEPESPSPADDQEVELGALLGTPVKRLVVARAQALEHLPEREPLEGRARAGVAEDVVLRRQTQERVQQSA